MDTFTCCKCGKTKPVQTDGGTGYGENDKSEKVCFACCALDDAAYMREHGRITLYLTGPSVLDYQAKASPWKLSNWPGTLEFPTQRTSTGRHNMAGTRYDVWFTGPDGAPWWGVQYGENTQLCHCRRIKNAA